MKHLGFVAEFNNPTKYGENFEVFLKENGIEGTRLPHKTAWKLKYNGTFNKFLKFKIQLAKAIKKKGSILLFSLETGECRIITKLKDASPKVTKVK